MPAFLIAIAIAALAWLAGMLAKPVGAVGWVVIYPYLGF